MQAPEWRQIRRLGRVGNGRLYLDALKQDEGRCGLGGKVNTNPGKQNARFRGSKICANRAIRGGEEIFVPYRS